LRTEIEPADVLGFNSAEQGHPQCATALLLIAVSKDKSNVLTNVAKIRYPNLK
jgi:hypothetical protein